MSFVLSNGKRELAIHKPLMNSSGVLGFSDELKHDIDLAALGAFITNPVSLFPRTPAHGPRLLKQSELVLLHTGLPNPGLDRALELHRSRWSRMPIPVILHVLARDQDEMRAIIDRLERVDIIGAIEVGLLDEDHGNDCRILTAACAGLLPAIARVPLTTAVERALKLEQIGAAAITLGPPRGTLLHDSKPVSGRLYGPNLAAQSMRACLQLVEVLNCPLIAGSAVFSRRDAEHLLAAGIDGIQLDTIFWTDPTPFLDPPLKGGQSSSSGML